MSSPSRTQARVPPAGSEGPPITVVVSSRDRPEHLARSLPAVVAALGGSDELIVVDSASRSEETRVVAESAGVRCVRSERPGLARARNLGVQWARHEVVAFTDDDCRPEASWLGGLRTAFTTPSVGFVTGRVRSSHSWGGSSVLDGAAPRVFDGPMDPHGLGHGANMAFRRVALVDLGLFDEELGAGAPLRSAEDVDMIFRCLAGGWEGRYEPSASVIHDQWRHARETLLLRYGYGLGNGAFRMKMLRSGAPRSGRLVLRSVRDQGLMGPLDAVRHGNPASVLVALSWSAGMAVGLARGALKPIHGGLFRSAR